MPESRSEKKGSFARPTLPVPVMEDAGSPVLSAAKHSKKTKRSFGVEDPIVVASPDDIDIGSPVAR